MSDEINISIPAITTIIPAGDGIEVHCPVFGQPVAKRVSFDGDEIKIYGRNLGFLSDPKFRAAYARGMNSGHSIMRQQDPNLDLKVDFRVHTILAAAVMASRLEGDFVECGVNTGIYSLAICDYLGFNDLDKDFYLFDTYEGVPEDMATPAELPLVQAHKIWYPDCYAIAQANFAPYPRARLVRGKVPDTLAGAGVGKVCYLSIDMNLAAPERAAMEFFWDKLSTGAPVVLDDYAWTGYEAQHETMNEFAASKGTAIMTLPTGQGLLIKT